ncbi:MAG: serine/threonine-protein kinase [Polyangiaceae bacterium]
MPVNDLQAGSIVHNRYRLVARIGGGGMGHVFRAVDLRTGETVALKILHRELSSSPDVTARLFQEARVVSTIQHPNIVRVLDADASEQGPFIAMEFLDGSSAGVLLNSLGRFDEPTTIATIIPVLGALDAAHAAGVVHRDLKPENVFICRESGPHGVRGSVHLLDFGIAKLGAEASMGTGHNAPQTRTGVVFGTPDYLSPEQATGDGPLDKRSDLFSLGIVIFELLTGKRPFTASTAVATAFRIVHANPPSFESLGVVVSGELRGIVRKLLSKSPDDRPASAGEVLRVLLALDPEEEPRQARLLRVLDLASERQRRSTQPPPVSSRIPALAMPTRDAVARGHLVGPVSPRVAGRTARGVVLHAIDAAIERRFGDLERERIVALLADHHAEELRRGHPSPLDAHDIDLVRRYVDVASRIFALDSSSLFELGRGNVDVELHGFVATLTRPAAFADVVRRSVSIIKCFFDFGTWTVTGLSPRRTRILIEGFDPLPPLLRAWLRGIFQRILECAVGEGALANDVTVPGAPAGVFAFELDAPH